VLPPGMFKRLVLTTFVLAGASTLAYEALAIPVCPPGWSVAPTYDSNGKPVPGGRCVPPKSSTSSPSTTATLTSSPARATSRVTAAPPTGSGSATPAETSSPPKSKGGCRSCTFTSDHLPTGWWAMLVAVAFGVARRRQRRGRPALTTAATASWPMV